jgi:hypothetical protein
MKAVKQFQKESIKKYRTLEITLMSTFFATFSSSLRTLPPLENLRDTNLAAILVDIATGLFSYK